jgi:galactonate dehydratase
MEIKGVKTYLVNAACRNLVFVQVHTDEGITGVGECTAAYGVGSLAVEGAVKELAHLLIGQDPFAIERLCYFMRHESFWGMSGGPFICSAISGLEQALWDIKGKALKVPVYEMLGGRVRDKIRVYANTWESHRKLKDYVEFAVKAVENGFTALKLYPFGEEEIVKSEQEVIKRIEAVRDAVGDEVDIMIDGGWMYFSSASAAIRVGKKLERFNPLFYEEPIAPDNIDAMAQIAANLNIPIAGGERIYKLSEFKEHLNKHALDVVQPDVGLAGGILESKKIVAMAEAHSVPAAPHNCNGPVATAATIQLDACTTNFLIQEIFPFDPPWHYDLVDEAYEKKIKNGYLDVPRRPGLGVELNEEEIAKHPYKPLYDVHSARERMAYWIR